MAARYSKVDYRRFASIVRSSVQMMCDVRNAAVDGPRNVAWSPEQVITDFANSIAHEFEKDNPGVKGFDRKQFFVHAGVNDPRADA